MDSFLKWIGGKKALREEIVKQFPEKLSRYIEVFGGAGWVLFARDKHAEVEVFNDINGELINLFKMVKYHCDALQQELGLLLHSRELFFDCKEQLQCRGLTEIQRAARYFVVVRESFGADQRSFVTRPTNIQKIVDNLKQFQKRLQMVEIENRSCEEIIGCYDRPEALFYLDPPYIGSELYYKKEGAFCQEDHQRLYELLKNIKGKFVLSYNDDPEIRKLYADFPIIGVQRRNTLKADDNSSFYREVIVKNF